MSQVANEVRIPAIDPSPAAPARLGEELPIFCERCGYSLHGLPQGRCGQCAILQFHCPECGHRQSINTLRPAFQAILGRMRASVLIASMLARIAFFGLLLFAWAAMGSEWSYSYNENSYSPGTAPNGQSVETGPLRVPAKIDESAYFAFGIFGFFFGASGRMLLLRWRRGVIVSMTLAILVAAAVLLGAYTEWYSSFDRKFPYASPFRARFLVVVFYNVAVITLAGAIVWPIWCGLVKVFLPQRAGAALLAWQRSMSDRTSAGQVVASLSREENSPLPASVSSKDDRPLPQPST